MSYEVTGKLIVKAETEQKTDSFKAREFVIETPGEYPQFVKFQLVQDRCNLLDPFEEGQQIKVHFDLRGREWNGKYFTNLNAWRLSKPDAEDSIKAQPKKKVQEEPPFPDTEVPTTQKAFASPVTDNIPDAAKEEADDLPF